MFNSKKSRTLTQYQMSELMEFVSNMMSQMVSTGQQVIELLDQFDLVVTLSAQGDYYQGAIYDLRRCSIHNDVIDLHDPPLFVGKRHFLNKEDFQSYLDDGVLGNLEEISNQAAVYISGLIRSINLQPNEDVSKQTYHQMPELSQYEEELIVNTLKSCLRESMNTGETSIGKIEDLDIVFISSFENLQTTIAVYKLSDCFFIGGEILSELPEHPIYISTLDQTNGFNGKANSDYKNTKYETYIHFVNACLSSSVKTYKKQ